MIKPKGVLWIITRWKLIIHLLLGTKRFGVNNQWTSSFDSMFARKERLSLSLVIRNYRLGKWRAIACGFLTRKECSDLGWESSI